MYAVFENTSEDFRFIDKKSVHVPPHIHTAVEIVYITKGTQEVGVGQELYHMEEGDVAVIFPELIHHYQVFDSGKCRSQYLLASPAMSGIFLQTLQKYAPKDPIIKKENVHPDVVYAFQSLYREDATGETAHAIHQAYLQIALARLIPCLDLVDKSSMESDDLIFRTVSYIAQHFTEEMSLTKMAEDLYVSPFVLSRIFSGTFHTNFNQYVNNTRLQYVTYLLKYTDQTVTEAMENAGFESQRTFNRVFKDTYHVSPRDYRKRVKEELIREKTQEAKEKELSPEASLGQRMLKEIGTEWETKSS